MSAEQRYGEKKVRWRRGLAAAVTPLILAAPGQAAQGSSSEPASSHADTSTGQHVTTDNEQYFLGQPLSARIEQSGKISAEPRTVTPGLQDSTVINGLDLPTVFRFAPDGSLLVGEKSGVILRYANTNISTPTVVADLSPRVYDYWDRGLLGMEIDKRNPNTLYAWYTKDAPTGKEPPVYNDSCADPTGKGCEADAELDKLILDPVTHTLKSRQMLFSDRTPVQYPSHDVGTILSSNDGKTLYLTHGDGASFTREDHGQVASNPPMGDPPNQGGALRAQTNRTLDGKMFAVNPDTGQVTGVLARGFRNPFRATVRPGTNEKIVADVGWSTWEEVNRYNPVDKSPHNYGWPCREGVGIQPAYSVDAICAALNKRGNAAVNPPLYTENHVENGKTLSSAFSGVEFTRGNALPAAFRNGLVVGDYGKQRITYFPLQRNGLPDPLHRQIIDTGVNPVDMHMGPDGNLYYTDIVKGTIQRISSPGFPQAVITADKTFGHNLPLSVNLDCKKSTAAKQCSWDTNGDGKYDKVGTAITATYTKAENVKVKLQVTNAQGLTNVATETLYPGDDPPVPSITNPLNGQNFNPRDQISFTTGATDREDGTVPDVNQSSDEIIDHCAGTSCHQHWVEHFAGSAPQTITFPDHGPANEYDVKLKHTATDSRGLSASTQVIIFRKPRTK